MTVMARQMPDQAIAAVLNRAGKKTGRGNGWTSAYAVRNHRNIATYRDGERLERGEVTLDEAAVALNISAATIRRIINERLLPASQLCKGAPWDIRYRSGRINENIRIEADRRRRCISSRLNLCKVSPQGRPFDITSIAC
jgi:hypothetical protein